MLIWSGIISFYSVRRVGNAICLLLPSPIAEFLQLQLSPFSATKADLNLLVLEKGTKWNAWKRHNLFYSSFFFCFSIPNEFCFAFQFFKFKYFVNIRQDCSLKLIQICHWGGIFYHWLRCKFTIEVALRLRLNLKYFFYLEWLFWNL